MSGVDAVRTSSETKLYAKPCFGSVGWDLIPEFADTPEGEWLTEHAHELAASSHSD